MFIRYLEKEFYVRGFRLLVTSEGIDTLKKLLENVMTIMSSETGRWTNDNASRLPEIARKYILQLIKGININDTIYVMYSTEIIHFKDDDNKGYDISINIFLKNKKKA